MVESPWLSELVPACRHLNEPKMQELPPGLGEEPAAAPMKLTRVKSPLNFPPLEAPAPGISADKQQRLGILLQRYKTDQVTPEQYHAERAKILAE